MLFSQEKMNYWLTNIDYNKLHGLSDMMECIGFSPMSNDKFSIETFAQQYNPCAWEYNDMTFRLNNEVYPIFIETDFSPDKPNKFLDQKQHINDVIKFLDAKKIRIASKELNINDFLIK